jgi:hypothetical protein
MERSALHLLKLHTDKELLISLDCSIEDFISLDMLIHSILSPDIELMILEVQRQLKVLKDAHQKSGGAFLIILHEENMNALLRRKSDSKIQNNQNDVI